jgi:hypothetical protein
LSGYKPNPGRKVTPRPKCLRVCNHGRDGGRPDNTDGLKSLAFLTRTIDGQTISLGKAQGARPTGLYTAKDQGILAVVFRAQRAFATGN